MNTVQKMREHGTSRLSVFAPKGSMPMEEALLRANVAGVRLAPNNLLTGSDHSAILGAFPSWTGTLFGYPEPGERLGKCLEYVDIGANITYVWHVPQEHIGKRNIALVAEPPGVYLEAGFGNTRTIRANAIQIMEAFPASDGWYLGDERYGLPSGASVPPSTPEALHLWRMGGSMISLVVRGYDDTNYPGRERLVNMGARPSDLLGAVSVTWE